MLNMYGCGPEDFYGGEIVPQDAYNRFLQSVQDDCRCWRLEHRLRADDNRSQARLEVLTVEGWETFGVQHDPFTPQTYYRIFPAKWLAFQAWLVAAGLG